MKRISVASLAVLALFALSPACANEHNELSKMESLSDLKSRLLPPLIAESVVGYEKGSNAQGDDTGLIRFFTKPEKVSPHLCKRHSYVTRTGLSPSPVSEYIQLGFADDCGAMDIRFGQLQPTGASLDGAAWALGAFYQAAQDRSERTDKAIHIECRGSVGCSRGSRVAISKISLRKLRIVEETEGAAWKLTFGDGSSGETPVSVLVAKGEGGSTTITIDRTAPPPF